jgi:type VI protein secretion system component VasF
MNTFMYLERATMQWLVQSYQRRTLRRAVRQAYVTFAYRYPEWVAVLFDAHFINAHLMPLLLRAAEAGEKITPAQVAELWARQVSMLPTLRQQHTARMIPAATHFLCMVADELAMNQVVGPEKNVLVETAVG